ncbi:TonB-dependent receptor plug domain-containing protein [Novosphingobium sp. ST904]|uniref:TonB-dependent receptor n=1 Tax=Novosphingobium sp. ST904 TaxID=1684385 RepID=UPI0006C837F1|nr:TonB-dependent receptor plug domain-containing protein [Novosphingobium sp. ST904]KPH59834.1 TonB-dependent receptor [Novosphingobium sp. ST904]TCM39790.1 iron complex outermembrane receptor protein [Novosphingobium sp. ST904]
MRSFKQLLLCSAGLASLGSPAFAQEQPDDSTHVNEANVIIVQARRRDEDVQDVPAVIDTVTADDISKLNLRDFREVSTLTPGLQLDTNANGIGGNAKMRGVNFDVNASGNNPTVEFYMNDAPITAGVVLQQMYDIGQIEVQRGPQGTLRGRASPSGSITVTTKKPDLYSWGGVVDMTANDIGTMNFKGALNIPVIEGIAAIRAAGVWDENEVDRVHSIYSNRDPFARTKSGRISALVTPTDWLRFEGMYQRLDRNQRSYDQIASFSEVNPDAIESPVYISSKDRLSNYESPRLVSQVFDVYNWRAEASGFGQRLIYQGQYYTQKIHSTENFDRGNLFEGDVNQFTDTRSTSKSHEIRLQNEERLFDMVDYVVGFFDSRNKPHTDLTNPTIVALPEVFGGGIAQLVQTPITSQGKTHEQSFFGNLTVHIGDATEVSGGLRRIDYKDESQLIVNGMTISNNVQSAKKWIYNGSLKHNFTPDLMVYVGTGSSWRPGINVVGDFNIAQSDLEKSFLHLPAETSKSYEIGMKSTLLDGRMRFNLTAYHQKFKNYPYRVPGSGVFFVNTVALRDSAGNVTGTAQQVSNFNFAGAVPVEVNGIEGDVSFDVMQGWTLGASASYSMGKIKGGTVPCNDLNGDGVPDATTSAPSLDDLIGAVGSNNIAACQVSQRSSFMAPFSATAQSEYAFPAFSGTDAYLRGIATYTGKSKGDPGNAWDNVGAYALVNLFAGLRADDGAWEVGLYAKNVFDTTKTLTRTNPLFTSYQQLGFAGQFDPTTGRPIFTGPTAATGTSTYTGVTTTAPREFGINVRYAFGSR